MYQVLRMQVSMTSHTSQLCLQIPALEAQLLQSLVPRDEADQRDVVLEVSFLKVHLPVINDVLVIACTDEFDLCVSILLLVLTCLSQCGALACDHILQCYSLIAPCRTYVSSSATSTLCALSCYVTI